MAENKNYWVRTNNDFNTPHEIKIVDYLDSSFYKGYIVKFTNLWPWYQFDNFQIVQN